MGSRAAIKRHAHRAPQMSTASDASMLFPLHDRWISFRNETLPHARMSEESLRLFEIAFYSGAGSITALYEIADNIPDEAECNKFLDLVLNDLVLFVNTLGRSL